MRHTARHKRTKDLNHHMMTAYLADNDALVPLLDTLCSNDDAYWMTSRYILDYQWWASSNDYNDYLSGEISKVVQAVELLIDDYEELSYEP